MRVPLIGRRCKLGSPGGKHSAGRNRPHDPWVVGSSPTRPTRPHQARICWAACMQDTVLNPAQRCYSRIGELHQTPRLPTLILSYSFAHANI